jgi:hypothetical protein
VALCEGHDNIVLALFYRLPAGELKQQTGTKRPSRSFDNATAFSLLTVHRETTARERDMRDHVSAKEIEPLIDRKVEELHQRVMAGKALREATAILHARGTAE